MASSVKYLVQMQVKIRQKEHTRRAQRARACGYRQCSACGLTNKIVGNRQDERGGDTARAGLLGCVHGERILTRTPGGYPRTPDDDRENEDRLRQSTGSTTKHEDRGGNEGALTSQGRTSACEVAESL